AATGLHTAPRAGQDLSSPLDSNYAHRQENGSSRTPTAHGHAARQGRQPQRHERSERLRLLHRLRAAPARLRARIEMARIIGGAGPSPVPTIGLAYDRGKQQHPAWAPLFEGYKPVAAWLAERRPDVLVFFYNDHASTFFFDFYPTFAIGVSGSFPVADEG